MTTQRFDDVGNPVRLDRLYIYTYLTKNLVYIYFCWNVCDIARH